MGPSQSPVTELAGWPTLVLIILFAARGSHLTPRASGKGEHSCFVASLPPSSGSSACPSVPDAHEKVETKDGGVGATAHPPNPPLRPRPRAAEKRWWEPEAAVTVPRSGNPTLWKSKAWGEQKSEILETLTCF